MPTDLQITVTPETIRECMWCGTKYSSKKIYLSCPIVITMKSIFSGVCVVYNEIWIGEHTIPLPANAQEAVKVFDDLVDTPWLRLSLPGFSFAITIPDEIIETINISELVNCKNLELC